MGRRRGKFPGVANRVMKLSGQKDSQVWNSEGNLTERAAHCTLFFVIGN